MSVSLTEQAVVERRKTVTRRLGWLRIKPGDRLTLCRKVMGRRSDEPLVRLAEVEVVSVRREPLFAIDDADVARECVPEWDEHGNERFDEHWIAEDLVGPPTPEAWVRWYASEMGITPHHEVTRIEWRYL